MEFLRENGNSRVKKLECNIVVRPRRLIFYCVINSILFLEFYYASRIFETADVKACFWSSCSICILIHFKLRWGGHNFLSQIWSLPLIFCLLFLCTLFPHFPNFQFKLVLLWAFDLVFGVWKFDHLFDFAIKSRHVFMFLLHLEFSNGCQSICCMQRNWFFFQLHR